MLGRLSGYGATADAYHLTAPDPEGDGAARAIEAALARRRGRARRGRLRQRARDLDAAQRPLRDRGDQARLRRARALDPGLVAEVLDRPPARRRRRGRGGGDGARAARRGRAADDQPRAARRRARPRLRPRRARRRSSATAALRSAISNSFGFGGHNVVLCFEAPAMSVAVAPRAHRAPPPTPSAADAARAPRGALRPGLVPSRCARGVVSTRAGDAGASPATACSPAPAAVGGRPVFCYVAGPGVHGRLAGRGPRRDDHQGDAARRPGAARRWSASSSRAAPGCRRATPRSPATGGSSARASRSPVACRRSRSSPASRPVAAPTRRRSPTSSS